MNQYHRAVKEKRICTKIDIWIGLKMLAKSGVKVEKFLMEEYKPTFCRWIWWVVSLFLGSKETSVQCYNPMEYESNSQEQVTVSTMIQWRWASPGTIQQLLGSGGRVQDEEILIAHGTVYSSHSGCHGFCMWPCIVRTSQGKELRTITSFELPEILKSKKGRVWFLEIPPK